MPIDMWSLKRTWQRLLASKRRTLSSHPNTDKPGRWGWGPHRHSDEAGSEGAVCPENHDTFGCTTRGAAASVNRLRKRAKAPRSKSPNSDEPAAKPRVAKNEGLAEGVGFEPTEPLTRFTAFRVLRTRPDYATPPCRHGNSLRFRRVLSGALGVPCTRNPLMRDRIPARGRSLFRRQRARGDEGRVPYGRSFVNRVRSGRKQL